MCTSVRSGARVFFCLMAAAAFSGCFLFGCGHKEEIEDGNEEGFLILPADHAWKFDIGNDDECVIFTPDGRIFAVIPDYYDGTTLNWKVSKDGKYAIKGDSLELTFYDYTKDIRNGQYIIKRVSSYGKVTTEKDEWGPVVFTKIPDVNGVTPLPGNPGKGGALVIGEGQAWINTNTDENKRSFVFWPDSTISEITRDSKGVWNVSARGTYKTGIDQGTIRITMSGRTFDGKYNVDGDNLVITLVNKDGTNAYKRTPGINVPPPADGRELVGDWMWAFSENEDGKWEPDVDHKRIVSFDSNRKVSRWDFWKEGDAWIAIEELGEWWVDNESRLVYLYESENNNNKEITATYTISPSGDKRVERICSSYDGKERCTDATFIRVDADEIKAALGTIYTTDVALRGDWVLWDGDGVVDYIYFRSTYFGGSGAYLYISREEDQSTNRYYYTIDDMLHLVVESCDRYERQCTPDPDQHKILSYRIIGSGNNRTLIIGSHYWKPSTKGN